MTSREETVLPPIDPSITDENDWWEFTLTDVKVLRPGKMLYANVLDASDENPVQVIGCLELKEDQEHLVLNPDSASKRIILDDVTHYAYGQTEDRSVEIWVAGKAGWYLISPAKGYLPTFNRMVKAVDMLYFLMDRHQHGRRQINPTFKSLCEMYVFHTHGDCETGEQSAEVFGEHASFLLRCMIEDDEDVDWKKTNVFVHLRRHFPDEYKKLMDQQPSNSGDDEDREEPVASTPRHDPAAVAKSQTDAIYQLIKDLKEEGHLAKRRLHIDLLTERLSDRYSFSSEDARKIIGARASAVLEKLEEEDTPGFKWSRYVIHRELTHAASKHTPLPTGLLTPLQPLEDSSDDERLGWTQKSVLRPKIATISNKVKGKRNRSVAVNSQAAEADGADGDDDDDDDDHDDQMEDVDTPSKTRGHELIRTPLASAKPRPNPDLSNTTSAAASLWKSVLSEPAHTPATIASNANHWTSEVSVVHPSDESDTWVCRMPGCVKVLTSKGAERKKEIEDHAGEHDWEVQMRVELVETERRMHSTMPVSNLMKYLVDQHLQQKRTAFPELYPAVSGSGESNGDGNGTVEHPDTTQEEVPLSTPTQNRSAEKQDQKVNGHTT